MPGQITTSQIGRQRWFYVAVLALCLGDGLVLLGARTNKHIDSQRDGQFDGEPV